ncbi:protein FLUORESCENT IN BLUE LIGHT, chloroplastic-like isoform X1 [Solanum dulcamara]|uniref:protein FLUORESCENT IN BLUE LIGHT, chloroplastic-like isoform X1 n=1 Tax=Solanum dulcamara TaxID=45834 RepID=UPI002485F0CD|nr:protein FLUORESCENT IN BLUE LIGHT, chloroplastic-like isoform X1 [Solanum dulcamara]
MAIMMKQGLLLWSPCPHSFSPKIQSFKQPIFQLTNKWRKEEETALLKNFLIQKKSNKKGIAIDFKEILQLRHSAATVIVTNALMMTSPLDALAETCEADTSPFNMLFNMPILLLVALIGATVGGLVARQRKAELQRLNEQLRQINAALRRQAKIESYAPNLSYAPAGGRVAESEVIVDPKKEELISRLKNGKKFLRNQAPDKAQLEFKTALDLAQNLKEPLKEKKAARGLGASLQRQGKYREAIKYHSLVLELSARHGEDSGSTEAYGAIADCYTELGDLEQAAKYYDQYIARLETD